MKEWFQVEIQHKGSWTGRGDVLESSPERAAREYLKGQAGADEGWCDEWHSIRVRRFETAESWTTFRVKATCRICVESYDEEEGNRLLADVLAKDEEGGES